MRYTVHLFALDADAFAAEIKGDPNGVAARVGDWLRDSDFDRRERKRGLDLARRICEGHPPDESGEDAFWALCWIGDAMLERVDVPELHDFLGMGFFEATRIWPVLARTPPPFPTPTSAEFPPGVGFLRHGEMPDAARTLAAPPDAAIGDLTGSPPPRLSTEDFEWARYAREQFVEVLESLAEDGLDLLTVVVHV